ncbi:MAG: S9 family peptidase [Woeseia sp.]|nr:S9 family peptidase [Woeseia sp.]
MAEKITQEIEQHGDVRIDEYFWMNDRDDPRVVDWLEKQNRWTEKVMAPMQRLKSSLIEEMKSRIPAEDVSAPYRDGDYWYYHRYVKGGEYPIYCRKHKSLDAAEEVLLDVNALAGDEPYFAVRNFEVSPDHKLAAYAVDTQGRRFYTIYFLDLENGKLLPDRIENVTSNFEWANDSETIVYVRQDSESLRAYQVLMHRLGKSDDELIYQEDDETFYAWVEKSLSSKMLFLVSGSTLSTEVQFIPADTPAAEPQLFLKRGGEHEYYVADGGDRFFVLSNDNATNFRLFEVSYADTARDHWEELVAHRDNVLLENADVFRDYIVLSTLNQGVVQLEVIDRASGDTHLMNFDDQVFTAYTYGNVNFASKWLRYAYESMATPDSTYEYNMETRERRLIKEESAGPDFERRDYETIALQVPARDGALIPVSMVYRKGIKLDGSNPLLQYGYGSYGVTIDPAFDSDRITLLDRGFIFAIAHVRGSSKLGREWYYAGRQLQKKNTFNDFIDVSRYLIDKGYTSPQHLYAQGGSAGGLLMGAVVNMAPELYNGIAAGVPFVDVVTTMLDDSIPLTTGEYDEWGDPRIPEFYDYMLSYSPYDNVGRHAYPNMLVTTGLHDSQVQYWEPAKWVAKINDFRTNDKLLLLKTDMQAGHSGKTGRYQSLEDTALYYSFYLWLEDIRE